MPDEAVIIFGATSGGGEELARRLRADGRTVYAVARATSDTKALERLGVGIRAADALSDSEVAEALDGIGTGATVVSFLGGGFKEGRPVDGVGNIHAIDAAVRAGARRYILMTSVGCGDSYDAAPQQSKDFWTELWKEKNRGEDHLKASPLGWTIVRPGGLRAAEPTGNGILTEDPMVMGLIHRVDLGAITYSAVNSDRAIGKTYTAVDRNQAQHARGGDIVAAVL